MAGHARLRAPGRPRSAPAAGDGHGAGRSGAVVGGGRAGHQPARRARAGPPGSPTGLPATADLVRIEARQRLGWVLRGLVASALERLGLETPLLVEARSSAVVLARPLAPGRGRPRWRPPSAASCRWSSSPWPSTCARPRAAPWTCRRCSGWRPGRGRLPAPGAFLVLRRDGLPDGRTLGPDGAGFAEPPAALVARVLATGATLAPGDVVAAAGAPLLGAPEADAPPDRLSRRARLRHGLARSILSGAGRSGYLRAGAMVRVDGDLLGRQLVRVVSPAGVAVPSGDAIPIRPVSPWGAP
ncbi:MAG: hypothetical protein R3F43_24035 [bacterium]